MWGKWKIHKRREVLSVSINKIKKQRPNMRRIFLFIQKTLIIRYTFASVLSVYIYAVDFNAINLYSKATKHERRNKTLGKGTKVNRLLVSRSLFKTLGCWYFTSGRIKKWSISVWLLISKRTVYLQRINSFINCDCKVLL